ncbi:hypothetical protein D3C78_171770 [compost metagenome]
MNYRINDASLGKNTKFQGCWKLYFLLDSIAPKEPLHKSLSHQMQLILKAQYAYLLTKNQ